MPYGKPRKVKGGYYVPKKTGGGFVSHSPSKAKAYKTAALREMASKGTLRVAKKKRKGR